jgi:tungstate transport system substrate-binding protein
VKKKRGAVFTILIVLVIFSMELFGCGSTAIPEGERSELILATTTSVLDSGLLDGLLERFEKQYPYRVKAVAVGSGAALLMARQGEADVTITHEPKAESDFMAAGFGESRRDLMYNDFIIVGPAGDPAGISGMVDAAEAFREIARTGSPFVSRGDASGTNAMELMVWDRAGVRPGGDWYTESGQGMGYTLRIADNEDAYTIVDRATFIVLEEALDLEIMVEGDPELLNRYAVIVTNPVMYPDINIQGAHDFEDFLFQEGTQEFIRDFGWDQYGQHLFYTY